MSGPSPIEWTDHSWNPVKGCTRVSEGCRNCYAEGIAARFSGPGQPYEGLAKMRGGKPRWTGKLALSEKALLEPLKRRKPTTYFVNSMSDLFHEDMPDPWLDLVFAVMASCPEHTFQILTKRASRMRAYIDAKCRAAPAWVSIPGTGCKALLPYEGGLPTNIWFGVSCEDQATANARIPDLLATPAVVRFVSAEPLLGPIMLQPWLEMGDLDAGLSSPGLDWVIVGGESGPGARPMHPAWARSIRDQCAAAGVPFHFKQWGEWTPAENLSSEQQEHFDVLGKTDGEFVRLGKRRAGRLLDGVLHNGMPQVRT